MTLTQSMVEEAALVWFQELGYAVRHGTPPEHGDPAAECEALGERVPAG